MNQERRKQIDAQRDVLEKIKNEIDSKSADEETGEAGTSADRDLLVGGWVSRLDDARTELETAKDDEQDYYDNMPEGLQGGDKGTQAEAAVSSLEKVVNELEELVEIEPEAFIGSFHEKYDDMISNLDEASA
jgi:hypothetical protein